MESIEYDARNRSTAARREAEGLETAVDGTNLAPCQPGCTALTWTRISHPRISGRDTARSSPAVSTRPSPSQALMNSADAPPPPSRPFESDGAPDPSALGPYELLHAHIDEVLREWRSMVAQEPWAPASPARLVNALPEMLPKLLRLGERGADRVDDDLSEFIARHHGFLRREDRIPLAGIAEEWNHLKRACWKVLRRHTQDEELAAAAVQRLDGLIDDAIGFSLRGYYAPELDELRGRGLERRTAAGDRRSALGDRRDD